MGLRMGFVTLNGCFRSSKKSVPSSILPNFAKRGDPALRLTCRDPPNKSQKAGTSGDEVGALPCFHAPYEMLFHVPVALQQTACARCMVARGPVGFSAFSKADYHIFIDTQLHRYEPVQNA